MLSDSQELKRLTGKSAKMGSKSGEPFSLQAGRLSGICVDLVPGKRIVLALREREFPQGVFSMATFLLESQKRECPGTLLTLIHRGVPKDLIPRISKEWQTDFWENIRFRLKNK